MGMDSWFKICFRGKDLTLMLRKNQELERMSSYIWPCTYLLYIAKLK